MINQNPKYTTAGRIGKVCAWVWTACEAALLWQFLRPLSWGKCDHCNRVSYHLSNHFTIPIQSLIFSLSYHITLQYPSQRQECRPWFFGDVSTVEDLSNWEILRRFGTRANPQCLPLPKGSKPGNGFIITTRVQQSTLCTL